MISNIRHTGIVVKDLEKSLNFYRDMLGFQISKQMEETGNCLEAILALKGVKITTVKMMAPDKQMIELLQYQSHIKKEELREICDIGISHIALTVSDLDSDYEKLRKKGIQFNAPPQISDDGHVKVTFCRAPEGTFIELVEVL